MNAVFSFFRQKTDTGKKTSFAVVSFFLSRFTCCFGSRMRKALLVVRE